MKIAVIGAGNAGQALAGYMSSQGHCVSICDVNKTVIDILKEKKSIKLIGKIKTQGVIQNFAYNAADIVEDADVVFIVTTALAHASVAAQISSVVKDGQIIVLNPGRTGGALEFRSALEKNGCKRHYYLCEAQTIVFACRIVENGIVNIVGNKKSVAVSTLPSKDKEVILPILQDLIPAFKSAPNVLFTSLENYGAVFHSAICLFNACLIEKGECFYFYKDVTPTVACFIEKLDKERVSVGKAYGVPLITAEEWLKEVYQVEGKNLYECLTTNKAYHDIIGPKDIRCRQLTEDIPTGAVPIYELGRAAGIEMPTYKALIEMASELLNVDFFKTGRTLTRMTLENMSKNEILAYITQ